MFLMRFDDEIADAFSKNMIILFLTDYISCISFIKPLPGFTFSVGHESNIIPPIPAVLTVRRRPLSEFYINIQSLLTTRLHQKEPYLILK